MLVTSAELLTDAFGRVQETVHEVVDGLSAAQLAARLDEDANSIAWLCWHLARVQDDHVADAFGVEQVWPGFADRFALPFGPGATGYGHSSAQVALVRIASGDLLTGYHDAVHLQTVALVSGLTGGSHRSSTTRDRSASVRPDTRATVCSCTASWYPVSRSPDVIRTRATCAELCP